MGDVALSQFRGRPTAFGAAGVLCLVVMEVISGGLSPLLIVFALVFIVIGVAALVFSPYQTMWTLACLWLLAVTLFAGYFAWTGITEGILVTAYASIVFGSLSYAAWVVTGLCLLAIQRAAKGA